MYPEIPITLAMWQSAYKSSIELGKLKNSLKDRNITGFLGEELYQFVTPAAKRANTYDYDFILREKKIDVKARNFATLPRSNFSFSVLYPREHQDVDFYVFTGIRDSGTLGYVFGYLSKEEFFSVAKRRGRGEPFPQGRGFYTEDSLVIELSQLRNFPEQNILRAVSDWHRRPISTAL